MKLFFILILVIVMPGCNGLFNTEPFVDTQHDDQGRLMLADTERNWRDFREIMNIHIKAEIDGKRPPGVSSWSEHWSKLIDQNRKNQVNPQKYIDYILNARKQAELPPLEINARKADL